MIKRWVRQWLGFDVLQDRLNDAIEGGDEHNRKIQAIEELFKQRTDCLASLHGGRWHDLSYVSVLIRRPTEQADETITKHPK